MDQLRWVARNLSRRQHKTATSLELIAQRLEFVASGLSLELRSGADVQSLALFGQLGLRALAGLLFLGSTTVGGVFEGIGGEAYEQLRGIANSGSSAIDRLSHECESYLDHHGTVHERREPAGEEPEAIGDETSASIGWGDRDPDSGEPLRSASAKVDSDDEVIEVDPRDETGRRGPTDRAPTGTVLDIGFADLESADPEVRARGAARLGVVLPEESGS